MEQRSNIQDVKELAIMVEHVIIQKLGMELQLVVNLGAIWAMALNGANNYFQQLQ